MDHWCRWPHLVIQLRIPLEVMKRSKLPNSLRCFPCEEMNTALHLLFIWWPQNGINQLKDRKKKKKKLAHNFVTSYEEILLPLPKAIVSHTGDWSKTLSLSSTPGSPPATWDQQFGKTLKNLQARFINCRVGMQEEEEVRKSVYVCIVRLVAKDLFVTTISSLWFYPRQRLHLTPGGLCFLRTFSDWATIALQTVLGVLFFIIFDSIKYTPASHKSVVYQRINHICNKGPLLFNWTVH